MFSFSLPSTPIQKKRPMVCRDHMKPVIYLQNEEAASLTIGLILVALGKVFVCAPLQNNRDRVALRGRQFVYTTDLVPE